MGEIEYRLGEPDNPEGFPICPYCGDFVATDEGDIAFYFCGWCKKRFPIEEVK